MAKAYSKPNITAGTGTGATGDPYNYSDTLSSVNTNGIVAGDQCMMMTNGVEADAAVAVLASPSGQIYVVPVDYAGVPSNDRWIVDGAGLGAGDLLSLNHNFSTYMMPELRNAPAVGLKWNGGADNVSLYGAKIDGSTSYGLWKVNGADNTRLVDLWIRDSGGAFAYFDQETGDTGHRANFYIEHGAMNDAMNFFGPIANSIFVADATGATRLRFTKIGTSNTQSMFDHCTFILKGDTSLITDATSYFIYLQQTTNVPQAFVTNCLFANVGAANANLNILRQASAVVPTAFKANVSFNIANDFLTSSAAVSGWHEATTVIDPNFVGDPDWRPQEDLTVYAILTKLAEEGIAHRDVGALSSKFGGGGGLAFRPRQRIHGA